LPYHSDSEDDLTPVGVDHGYEYLRKILAQPTPWLKELTLDLRYYVSQLEPAQWQTIARHLSPRQHDLDRLCIQMRDISDQFQAICRETLSEFEERGVLVFEELDENGDNDWFNFAQGESSVFSFY
jgi:hypothetical protein